MSISNAMQSGISGLIANSSAVGSISSNIANANTDGYRRSFAQMVTTASASGTGAGVRAEARAEISTGGTARNTGNAADLAINGGGFFVVSRNADTDTATDYAFTRAGSFRPDENGNLANAAGLFLSGYAYDDEGRLGTVDRTQFTDLQTVNVSSDLVNGQATSRMSIAGNLPAQETGPSTTGQSFVTSQEYFTALGGAERVEFEWTPSTTPNQWQLAVSAGGAPLGSVDVTFADTGAAAGTPSAYTGATSTGTAPAGFAFDAATGVATLTIDNGTTPQTIELALGTPGGTDGMTQFAGDYTPAAAEVNGRETGQLVRFDIDDKGDLYGVFDNNSRRLLYNIPLAEMANPDGLQAIDGNAFLPTQDSGNFRLSSAGTGSAGSLQSGALETSNVELAEELTQLIQTQRAYSSNAKIITTVDEMMDETTRLKR